jgi:hypothetical protein
MQLDFEAVCSLNQIVIMVNVMSWWDFVIIWVIEILLQVKSCQFREIKTNLH